MTEISVQINSEYIKEIVLRSQGRADIAAMINHSIESFLDRTRGDPDIWSIEHANAIANEDIDDTLLKYGSPSKGYYWLNVHLPNSTSLKISYKGRDHFAEVRHQQIYYDNKPCSPSQYASRVADNTSRNAWRDIWIKRPSDHDWQFANNLRV